MAHHLLMSSSCLFLAPLLLLNFSTISGTLYGALCALTSLVSVASWADRRNAFLMEVDRTVARSSGLVVTIVGFHQLSFDILALAGLPIWFAMLILYHLGRVFDSTTCHAAFHFCVAAGMCLVALYIGVPVA